MSNGQVSVPLTSLNLKQFLQRHEIKKGSTSQLPVTITELGKYKKAKYHIPAEEEDTFANIYHEDIIKSGKYHNLIERQLIGKEGGMGPLLCDIDLRFAANQTERVYTDDNLFQLFETHMDAIKETCEMDEDVHIIGIITEKPNPRVVIKETGNIVKDGIHLIVNLMFSTEHQMLIREKVVNKLQDIWSHMPIQNTGGWEDVVDTAISSGANGWLLPNCKKADDTLAYEITKIYEAKYNIDDSKWDYSITNVQDSNRKLITSKYYKLMFPRYKERPVLLTKSSVLPELEKRKKRGTGNGTDITQNNGQPGENTNNDIAHMFRMRDDVQVTSQMVLMIRNEEDLEGCTQMFLQSLGLTDYELREARDLVSILPESYYGPGSYNQWIKVGFTLHNISTKLLIVWIELSAKSSNFQYSDIPSICDTWFKFAYKAEMGGLTKRSLVYWAKKENPEGYEQVQAESIEYYIDLTIDSNSIQDVANPNKKSGHGCADWDLALVLYIIMKNHFVCASVGRRLWYHFNEHRWVKNDCGTSLRKYISTGMKKIYYDKAVKTFHEAHKFEPDTEEHKRLFLRANKILDVSHKLGSTTDKDKIMKESMELFHDDKFLDKLDQNKYLFCCKNGVLDYENNVFRKGCPEDYLSMCSDIEYHEIDEVRDAQKISELKHYIRQLFPIQDLEEYAWKHMASFLIGDLVKTQCLHYWTGIGSNGKSLLVTLLRKVLGKYTGDLDPNFYTSERPKRGQSTPELAAIVGKRLAITSEISEKDKMNEGPMKQLTSGTDIISYRPLYGELMEFVPQCHPIIMANKYLEVSSRDHGTWRRIRVLPFLSLFTRKIDPTDTDKPYQFLIEDGLEKKFDQWAEVFFAMLAKIAFQTHGKVDMCDTVREHSESYQKEQDFILEYITGHIEKVTEDNVFLRKSLVVNHFNQWCKEEGKGNKRSKGKEFLDSMNKMFGQMTKTQSGADGWRGIAFKVDESQEEDTNAL